MILRDSLVFRRSVYGLGVVVWGLMLLALGLCVLLPVMAWDWFKAAKKPESAGSGHIAAIRIIFFSSAPIRSAAIATYSGCNSIPT